MGLLPDTPVKATPTLSSFASVLGSPKVPTTANSTPAVANPQDMGVNFLSALPEQTIRGAGLGAILDIPAAYSAMKASGGSLSLWDPSDELTATKEVGKGLLGGALNVIASPLVGATELATGQNVGTIKTPFGDFQSPQSAVQAYMNQGYSRGEAIFKVGADQSISAGMLVAGGEGATKGLGLLSDTAVNASDLYKSLTPEERQSGKIGNPFSSPTPEEQATKELEPTIVNELKGGVNPQNASVKAQSAAAAVREAKAIVDNNEALGSFANKDATKLFSKMTPEENIRNISDYERTGQFSNAPKGYSELYKQSTDTAHSILQDVYGNDRAGYIENYVRRQFDFGSKADEAAGTKYLTNKVGSLSANKSVLRPRTLDIPLDEALKEMRDRGITVEPRTTNPELLRQWTLANARQAKVFADTWQGLKDGGLIKFVKAGEKIPEDLVPLKDRVAEVFYPSEKGMVRTGQYFADRNVARVLNNAVSRGLENSPTYKGLRSLGNTFNQFQLGLSAFHLTGTAINAGISDMALGLRNILDGNFGEGATQIGRSLVPGKSFLRYRGLGKNFINNLTAGNPIAEDFLKEKFNPAGGRLGIDQRYLNESFKQIKKAFEGKSLVGKAKAIGKIPSAIIEKISEPLLTHAIPRVKIGAFMDLANDITSRMPNASPAELKGAYAKAWDSIDNRFGQLVYDNLFWNKTAKDLAMISTRSVGWNLGTIRELGGGIGDVARLAKGGKLTDRMLYAASLPIYAGMIGAVYQYLHTGKGPSSLRDYFYPQNGLVDNHANPDRTSLPTYMKDVYAYGQNPLQTVENKASPLLSMAFALANNKDYYGDMIRNPQDSLGKQLTQTGKYVINTVSPFSVSQAIKTWGESNKPVEQTAENVLGFTKAPSSVTTSDSQKQLLGIIAQSKGGLAPRTPEQIAAGTVHQQAETLYKQLKALPVDQANAQASALAKSNPSLFTALKGVVTDDKNGVTYDQRLMRLLGVSDGERANYIYNQVIKLPTADAKNAYINDLVQKKIATPQVLQQVLDLKNGDNTPSVPTGVKTNPSSVIDTVLTYAKALGTDPVTAFNRIFTGQRIRSVIGGAVIVDRMSLAQSSQDKKDLGGASGTTGMTLDHTIPLELGGSNDKSNLKLVPVAQAAADDQIENLLGDALRSGKINKQTAQDLIVKYKNGDLSASDVQDKLK